ncbi:MAG: hypothetical protein AAF413_01535 [Patescibacteria group bacterium]
MSEKVNTFAKLSSPEGIDIPRHEVDPTASIYRTVGEVSLTDLAPIYVPRWLEYPASYNDPLSDDELAVLTAEDIERRELQRSDADTRRFRGHDFAGKSQELVETLWLERAGIDALGEDFYYEHTTMCSMFAVSRNETTDSNSLRGILRGTTKLGDRINERQEKVSEALDQHKKDAFLKLIHTAPSTLERLAMVVAAQTEGLDFSEIAAHMNLEIQPVELDLSDRPKEMLKHGEGRGEGTYCGQAESYFLEHRTNNHVVELKDEGGTTYGYRKSLGENTAITTEWTRINGYVLPPGSLLTCESEPGTGRYTGRHGFVRLSGFVEPDNVIATSKLRDFWSPYCRKKLPESEFAQIADSLKPLAVTHEAISSRSLVAAEVVGQLREATNDLQDRLGALHDAIRSLDFDSMHEKTVLYGQLDREIEGNPRVRALSMLRGMYQDRPVKDLMGDLEAYAQISGINKYA